MINCMINRKCLESHFFIKVCKSRSRRPKTSSDVLFVGNTKLVWFEVCSNPLNMVVDLKATLQTVKEFNSEIMVGIDNTFLSPWIVVTYFL